MLAGDPVEGTVLEDELLVDQARFVPDVVQGLRQELEGLVGADAVGPLDAEQLPVTVGDLRCNLVDRQPLGHRGLGCVGEHVAEQVVVPLGERNGEVAPGTAVQLRGPTRAGPGTAGEPAELHLEEPVGDHPVEVELRGVHRDPDRLRCRLPTDGRVAVDDVAVEPATQRIGQGGDPDDVGELVIHF